MTQVIDITGKRFGHLVVKRYDGLSRWHCICDCGTVSLVNSYKLRSGHTSSCGCLSVITAKREGTTHGMYYTPEYKVWASMIARCTNVKNKSFKDYGGRGILVCDRWKAFPAFIEDMGRRPSARHSIDRKNVNGNYEPGNCRWATALEQAANKRVKFVLVAHADHGIVDYC